VGIGLAVAKAERERRAVRARLPPRERQFGLRARETAAHGCRRIALGQLDLAIELLHGESSVPAEEAVHETRKALKRLRALMRLLEGEIGSRQAARERAVLRDAAARLAGARDAEVMVSTLDALVRRHPRKLGRRRGLIELRKHLQRERRAAARRLGEEAATREQVAEELSSLRARVARWKLPDRPAGKLVAPGLEHIYRAGRTGRRSAARGKAGPKALHRWRKHVKDLRYALEVLDVRDPRPGAGARAGSRRRDRGTSKYPDRQAGGRRDRREGKRIAKLARRADALGEALGEEHDLMLLAERAGSHKPLKRHRRTRKLLLRAISRRRRCLRKRGLREGRRLYERKPRRFVSRVRASHRAMTRL
jgi:CHAD domain